MQIEPATLADLSALCELLDHLFVQEAEFSPDRVAQERGLRMIIEDPAVGTILVARQAGQVIGMVNLLFLVSTALGERVVLLEDMVTDPVLRGSGVGSRLLKAAVHFAEEQGYRRITLLTDADNLQAQRFYRGHGFKKSSMVPMRLALSGRQRNTSR